MNKLLEFQKRVDAIKKDSKNPFFKSSYLSLNGLLDAIKPLLNELELTLIQPLGSLEGRPSIKTILIDTDNKELIKSEIILPDLTDPQKMGSAITYYRRYAIQSMLLLQAEDDDAEGAKPNTPPVKPAIVPKTAPKVDTRKSEIAKLLQKNFPSAIKSPEEYKEVCMTLTGFELLPENYDAIINQLK